MPTLTVDHDQHAIPQTIFYRDHGSGQPILLLHGFTETSADMDALAEWLTPLGYRVIVPDVPGYGQSVPPLRTYPPDFYQRDTALLAAFVGALGLRDVHVMGFSDGGEIALLMAVTRPDLCRSVTAWGAVGAFGPEACQRSRQGLPATWITDDIRRKHPDQDVDAWPEQWADGFCAMIAAGGDISLSRAHQIACPLLLMLGDDDRLNPPSAGERYIQQADRGGGIRQFKVFEYVGHAIHEQQPDEFKATVSQFLRAIDGGVPSR